VKGAFVVSKGFFWLNDEQFARISPHLPAGTRGKPRVDDRRVISGIIHVIKSGAAGLMRQPAMDHEKRFITG
jgi:transposase